VKFFQENQNTHRLVLYACTSGYPVPFEDANLLEIVRLQKSYGEQVKAIGFSGHHLGIAIDQAAYTLGATWIERHFTKDRTWKGTDHAASLELGGLQQLVRDLSATFKALQFKPKEILDIESIQRDKLKYRKS
jgi:N-acetylneuraminate synthase